MPSGLGGRAAATQCPSFPGYHRGSRAKPNHESTARPLLTSYLPISLWPKKAHGPASHLGARRHVSLSVRGVRQRHLANNPLVFHRHSPVCRESGGKGIETAQNHAASLKKGYGSTKQRPCPSQPRQGSVCCVSWTVRKTKKELRHQVQSNEQTVRSRAATQGTPYWGEWGS